MVRECVGRNRETGGRAIGEASYAMFFGLACQVEGWLEDPTHDYEEKHQETRSETGHILVGGRTTQ